MKKTVLAFLLVIIGFVSAQAQIKDPVQWTYTATKKADNTYEIVISAKYPGQWHLYSQSTPDGGPRPTVIKFKTNPLVTVTGKPKEVGAMKTDHSELFGVDVKYYASKVDFVQTVKVKGNVKTNITGTIEYMVCDDTQCLPPTTKEFSVKLQ